MIFDFMIEESLKSFGFIYRWFEQYVVNYFVNFGKGFEQVFIMLAVIAFTLLMVFILIRHVKKLPKYYVIGVVDLCGGNIILEDLKVNFNRFDVAKSYSQFYQMLYGPKYRFRVIGSNGIVDRVGQRM